MGPLTKASVSAEQSSQDAIEQAFVRERATETWLKQSRPSQVNMLLASLLIGVIWWVQVEPLWPLLWMALVLLVMVLRLCFTEWLIRMPSRLSVHRRVGLLLLTQGLLLALPLLAFDQFTTIERAAVSIILIAVATASVVTTSGFRMVFLAFAAPMLIPLALVWALYPPRDASALAGWGLAALILAYLAYLVGLSRQVSQVVEEAARYRYGQSTLNRALSTALDAADASVRAKTQFLAAASHDLRQPMHSMNVLVAALSLKTLDDSAREIVDVLDTVNQTITRQLDGLLDISKLDAGTVVPTISICHLDRLLQSHFQELRMNAAEKGVLCTVSIECPLAVHTDEALLNRALSNLTDNALKFTRGGGQVALALRRRGDEALLEISDSGIGIPADQHEKVFDEFYQVGNTQRDRAVGLGLGLSIVKRLCVLIGARLEMQSVVGAGTRFSISLPAVALPEAVQSGPVLKRGSRQSMAVLVIDDELMVRQSMRLLLQELGCTVHDAVGSIAAAKIAASESIDLILSDMRLAEGDSGIEAIAQVRKMQPGVRAVLVTGDTAPERLREAQASGLPLLHKPLTLPRLLDVLDA
jgi:signal transduction histidine kinase/CheY-like chemotaxis protein